MKKLLVAGLINVETSLKIDAFPYKYTPVRYPFFGVGTSVSGVGYNISKALTTLGHDVRLCSLVGRDVNASLIRSALGAENIDHNNVLPRLDETPQSVILYDGDGRRSINSDLKAIQETAYPLALFEAALAEAHLAVICNINFARPLLAAAKSAGVPIATDVHAIGAIDDAYNTDYMRHADILFQSHENLPDTPEAWVRQLWAHYQTPVAVVGMGAAGALLGVYADRTLTHVPAVAVRPVVNTVGAGDALFSAFVHGYLTTQDPVVALRKAVCFAGYKIGDASGSAGFLTAQALDDLYDRS